MIFKTDGINNPAQNRDDAKWAVNLPVRRRQTAMVSSLMEFLRLMVLALAAGFYLSAASGFAASMTWGTPTTIRSDTDVITSGSLVYAYTGGTNGATVNSAAFAAGNSGTAWGGNVSLSGFGSPYNATNAPWTNLSTSYKIVLQGGAYGGATTGTVTLKGLTPGHFYRAQIWVNDARATGAGRSATATAANQVNLDYNNLNAQGGVGQYVVGSFVANSTNQTFTLTSSSSVQLNAINLRDNGVYVFSPTRVNLAKYQPVIADSTNGSQSPAFITDGLVTDTSCWQSDNTGPHWAEVDFPFPVTVGSAQLVMGLDNVSPPTGFLLQYLTNGIWTNVPGTTVSGNTNKEINIVFSSPVKATAFRFYDSVDATVNLRELTLYPPNGSGGFAFGTDFLIDLARKQPAFATTNTFSTLKADGSTYGVYLNGGLDMGNGGYTLSSSNGTVGNGSQISGITGASGTIMNTGPGNLWITGSNTFAGTFRATNGPLIFQTVYSLQNATMDMNAADSGAVSFSANVIIGALTGSRNLNLGTRAVSIGNNNADTTYSGALTNSGSVTKIGTGTLSLNGTNTYTGLTTVSRGTLGGSGVISGPVTIAVGGTLAPGNSLGTLTINNNFTNAGTVFMELNASSLTADQVTGVMDASYGGSLVVSNLNVTPLAGAQVYQLFNASGTQTGNFASVTVKGAGAAGVSGTFNPTNGQLTLANAVVSPPVINQVKVSYGKLILQGINGTASANLQHPHRDECHHAGCQLDHQHHRSIWRGRCLLERHSFGQQSGSIFPDQNTVICWNRKAGINV